MKYVPALPLWPEQAEGLRRMLGKPAFALFMAMRTGKSPTLLAEFGHLEASGKVRDLVVVAPGGVYRTWAEAITEHVAPSLLERLSVHVWSSGAGVGERRRFSQFLSHLGPRALLINVEALSRPGPGREAILAFLRTDRPSLVAIDESTCIKNNSKRTKFINGTVRPLATFRRILSGLPTPREPIDLFYQFEFLDWNILGFRSWYIFRNHIAIMKLQYFGGRSVLLINKNEGDRGYRPEAISEMTKAIAPYSYRVAFRPKIPSTYSIRHVEMTKEQKKHYESIRDFATTQLDAETHVTASVVIAQIMRMHQVLCGHVRSEDGMAHAIPENKTSAVLELLEDYGGKAIIWFTYIEDLNRVMDVIEKEYGPGSTAKFSGANMKTREAEEKRFKTDPRCRFLGATAGAGGKGRQWSVADLVINYSSSDDLEKREQSEQRSMIKDKPVQVDNVDIIHPGTVEEKILKALRAKINMSSAINGDNYKEWLI